MKYLKLFENHSQYEDYVASGLTLPNVSHCIQEIEVHYNPLPHDYSQDYLTFEALEDGTFTFTFAQQTSNVISYSIDNGSTWTDGNSVEVNNGDKVAWKGTMTPSLYGGSGTFTSTANFNVQGNAMSLLYGDNFKNQIDLSGKGNAFENLFLNNTKVVNAENLSLPATTLDNACYLGMFSGCTSLTTAPELPATTLAIRCYRDMFRDCTSLISIPKLPATTLAEYCYNCMFWGCTSLTTAPELPATTLTRQCYYGMFQGCTSLTTASELPATALAAGCYQYMFSGCTSLTAAPELPATTLASNCYSFMFRDCTNLNYIKAMFTTRPSSSYTNGWVINVASSGTFVKNSAATWDETGANGVPNGWTVQTASA